MKIRLSYDSRDFNAHQAFGQVSDFATPVNFDDPTIAEKIQPVGNVKCTCFTTTYIAQNKTKKEYDLDELFDRIPHTLQGADPRDVLSEIVKNGFKIKGTNIYDKPYNSYWRADTGTMDAFDNCRSSLKLVQSPIALATHWYEEWLNLPADAVMPVGKTPLSGHMYANQGWKMGTATITSVDGEPMFIIEWWGGRTYLMPRATFNEAMKPYGMQAWVLSDSDINVRRSKTLGEMIKDTMINLIILLREKVKTYKVEPVVPAPVVAPLPQPALSMREKIYVEARKWLGKDASPTDQALDELACAESVCNILQQAGVEIPSLISTAELKKWLSKSPLFQLTIGQKPGNIIISPTGAGNGSIPHGHTGIFSEQWIMSNDSKLGMWLENYKVEGWVKRFRIQGGYPIYFYEAVKGP